MTTLATIVVTLLLAAPAAAQLAAGRPADVFDANGDRVGTYLGPGSLPTVLLEFNGKSFAVGINGQTNVRPRSTPS